MNAQGSLQFCNNAGICCFVPEVKIQWRRSVKQLVLENLQKITKVTKNCTALQVFQKETLLAYILVNYSDISNFL